MKKIFTIAAVIVTALAALGIGVAFAQGQLPPEEPYASGMMLGSRGGYGPMHEYVEKAFAEKLNLTEEKVEELLASGIPMYQIALDNGIAEEDLAYFMAEVHKTAFDQAVADGVFTQEHADWMLEHMQDRYANGFGNCPMDGTRPQDGSGFRGGFGSGMMGRGGGHWQNQSNP